MFADPRYAEENSQGESTVKVFFCIFLLCGIPSLLLGQVDEGELKARAFFEAGDYPHAKSAYEDLLDRLDGWKKEIVEYNIATTLQADGRLDEAISRFEVLGDQDIELPLLEQRLASNLALARTLQLEEQLNALKDQSKASTKDYNQIYLLFQSALQEINKASASWCKLQTVEGAPKCPQSYYLQQMERDVKERFHGFFEEYSTYRLASLEKLLQEFPKSGPLKDAVKQLLAAYELVLINDPLQATDLSQILEVQTMLEERVKQSDPAVMEEYGKSQKYLMSAIQSVSESHPIKAHLFAEVARFYLNEILENLDPIYKSKAGDVLENAIAKQGFLLLMENLKGQMSENEKDLGDVNSLMTELQFSVLKTADLFMDAVIAQQKEVFQAPAIGKDRCQCRPWDEVIPLFIQGYTHAERAYRHLEKGNVNLIGVKRLQKSAINKWKEALQKMRSSSVAQQKQEQQKQPEQMQPQKEQLQENRQNAKFNEILRMVQDMENDDRSQPQQLKSTGSKREDRPW